MERSPVIGVDVGGTKIAAALVTREGSIEGRIQQPTDVDSEDALLSQLDAIVEGLRSGVGVAALGFGIPSRIDQRRGRAVASVNVPLVDVDFRDRMRAEHGLPVAIDNDGNAAAIAEWQMGAARGARDLVMLTLGTGVGGGLIFDGKRGGARPRRRRARRASVPLRRARAPRVLRDGHRRGRAGARTLRPRLRRARSGAASRSR